MKLGFLERTDEGIREAWRMSFEKLYCEKTKLFYDYLAEDAPDGAISNLPDPETIRLQIPNPCGWGTGMEDSVLNGGIMLEALVTLYQKTRDAQILPVLHEVFEGFLACATVSDQEGFLARSISPVDGRSHYINSSRDQYTHWVYMSMLLFRSGLATQAEKAAIARVLAGFAGKAEREIRNGADEYLREDGQTGMVCRMWGKLEPHEYLRLPMIYLAAWAAGGDEHWYKKYKEYREEAFRLSEAICKPGETDRYLYAYALLQMQYSLRLIYDLEQDREYADRAARLMGFVADFSEKYTVLGVQEADAPHADRYQNWRKESARFWGLINGYAYYVPQPDKRDERVLHMRNTAEAVIIRQLCPKGALKPEQRAMFFHVLEKTDFRKATQYWPIIFCDAWAMLK